MLTEYERKVLSAYAEDYGVATMQDLINLTFSMKGLSLLTDFSDIKLTGACGLVLGFERTLAGLLMALSLFQNVVQYHEENKKSHHVGKSDTADAKRGTGDSGYLC